VCVYVCVCVNVQAPRTDAFQKKKGLQKSWFNFMFGKYIPFTVRERFRVNNDPLKKPEMEQFDGVVGEWE